MDYAALKAELTTDPLERGYAAMDADAAAASLNAADRTVVETGKYVNTKSLYSTLGAAAAETIIGKLEAAAASASPLAPIVKRAVSWFLPSEQGIDVGNTVTRGMIDQLVTASVLTSEEAASLNAIAEKTVSRAAELGLGTALNTDVEIARGTRPIVQQET